MKLWRYISLLLLICNIGYSQYCGTTTSNVSITPTTTSQLTASYSSGRRAFNFVATAGCIYEFSTCGQTTGDSYLRLYSTGTGGTLLDQNDNFCGTQSTLTWTATVNGTVSVLLTRASCNALSVATKMSYRLIGCRVPPCTTPVSPINSLTNANINQTLSWNTISTATSYDVYFGTNPSPPLVATQISATYNPGTLSYSTTYYWKVVPRNPNGTETSCSTWSFTTKSPGCLTAQYGQFPSTTYNPGCSGTAENITTTGYASEYSLVTLISNVTYTLSSSNSADFITISDDAGTTVLAYGTGSVVYNCTTDGDYRFYTHTNELCGASTTSRSRRIQCSTPPPPSNDLSSGAQYVGLCGGTFNGNTKFATQSGDSPSCYTGSFETWTAPGVWYTILGNGKNVTASLCGSNFDTKIFIYTGTPSNLTCLTFNDDFCSTQSEVTFLSTLNTTYYVLVTGYGSSKGAFTLSVNLSPSPPTITSQPTSSVVCQGQSTTFSVVATGNQGPLTYQWYLGGTAISGATSSSCTVSTAGTYYVIVSNSCGATIQSSNATLTVNPLPNITVTSTEVCNGYSTTISSSGGVSYLWSNGSNSTSINVSPITTTNYTVTGTDINGCQKTVVSTVAVNPNPQVLLNSLTSTICAGGAGTNNIIATASSGTSGYSYQWKYFNGTSWVNTGTNSNVLNATPTITREYRVIVTDIKGCQVTSLNHTVNVVPDPINPTLDIKSPNQNDVCVGTNLSATFNPGSDGVNCQDIFQYSIDNGVNWNNYTPGFNISTNNFTQGTVIQIRGRRGNCTTGIGCSANSYTVLAQWNIITPPILSTSVNDITCSGGGNGSINLTVSGSLGPFTFNWSGPNGFTSTLEDITDLATGIYTVVVTTPVGCPSTKTVSVTEPSSLVLTLIGSDALCIGQSSGNIDLTVSGGTPSYSYLWSTGSTNEDIFNLPSGTYTISVTDNNNCVATSTVTISDPTPFIITVNSVTITTCDTNPVQLIVSTTESNNTYLWSTGSNSNIISVLPTTTTIYTVESWNQNNCYTSAQSTVTVLQSTLLPLIGSVTGPTQAYPYMVSGNIATYSVSPVVGATNYQWYIPNHGVFFVTNSDSNLINVQINQNFVVNSNGGDFYVKVTNGCDTKYSDTLHVDVLQNPNIVGSDCGIPLSSLKTYYVSNSLPGLTYQWIPPYGATIVSGQGNDTIVMKCSIYFQSNTNLTSNIPTIYGTFTGTKSIFKNPNTPTMINGLNSVCADNNTIYEYYVDSVPTASYYIWNLPNGCSIIDGIGNDTIHVVFNTTFVGGNLSCMSANQCGSSAMRYFSIQNSGQLYSPGTISGPGDLCPYLGTTTVYSVTPITGASFTWIVPNGMTLVSGQGTNVITVQVSNTFTSGVVSVKLNQGCGDSPQSTRTLSTTQGSITVSTISGLSNVCSYVGTNQTVSYSISSISGVNYNWSVPANVVIVSGQGSNVVNVKFLNGFNGGDISVTVSGGCALPTTKSRSIIISYPGMILSGNSCIENGVSYNYSINLSNMSSYNIQYWNWVVPGNAIITQGQGTPNITVLFPSNFESNCINNLCDSIKCYVQFPCGIKLVKKIIGMTTYPVSSIAGPATTCGPDTIQLSVPSIPNRATNFIWGKPNGTQFISINGVPQFPSQGVSVYSQINTTFLGGSYNVQSVNQCGSTSMSYFYVNKSCPTSLKLNNSENDIYQQITTLDDLLSDPEYLESLKKPFNFIVYPNPAKTIINLKVFRSNSEYYLVNISNVVGQTVYSSLHENEDIIDLNNFTGGSFFITLIDKEGYKITKQLIIE